VAWISAMGGKTKARTCFHRCVCHRGQSTRFETNNQDVRFHVYQSLPRSLLIQLSFIGHFFYLALKIRRMFTAIKKVCRVSRFSSAWRMGHSVSFFTLCSLRCALCFTPHSLHSSCSPSPVCQPKVYMARPSLDKPAIHR